MNRDSHRGNKRDSSKPGRSQGRKNGSSRNSSNWQKYAVMPMNALRFIVERFLLAWELLAHRNTPMHVKLLLAGLVVYIISPIDFIPDMIPLLGITDDVALLVMGWNYAEGFVTPQMRTNVDTILQRWS